MNNKKSRIGRNPKTKEEYNISSRNVITFKPSKILSVSQKIKFKIVNIDKDTKRISLSYKATLNNPWDELRDKENQEVKIKINTHKLSTA